MNTDNKDLFEDDFKDLEDIEQMLNPQCDFKASDSLKEEVMERAKDEIKPRRTVKMWPWLAAACVAAIVFLFRPPRTDVSTQVEQNPKAVAQVAPADNTPETDDNQSVARIEETTETESPKPTSTPKEDKGYQRKQTPVSNTQLIAAAEPVQIEEQPQADEKDHEREVERLIAQLRNQAFNDMQTCDNDCFKEKIMACGYAINKSIESDKSNQVDL